VQTRNKPGAVAKSINLLLAYMQDMRTNIMELSTFENITGESIVCFQLSRTSGPEYEKDHSLWYCHLTVDGKRIFEYGCPCGTCGIVFRKVGSTTHQVTDTEAVQLLGALDVIPPDSVIKRLARVLEPGQYHPVIIEGPVLSVEPKTSNDYFATDAVRLFGSELAHDESADPGVAYYRFGLDFELERTGRATGQHKALVTAVAMPLHDPSQLNRDRIEFWKRQHDAGVKLTAFAVSVVDNQSPAMDPADPNYKYEEQFLLANCILDGHHRIQAAAELGVAVRILSLVRRDLSLVKNTDDLIEVLCGYIP